MENETIKYYDENSRNFAESTINADLHVIQDRFIRQIRAKGRILDLGCGAGRDARYFIDHGFHVDAIDGSKEMCRIAQENTGIQIKCMKFDELDDHDTYDGIWACASILHLSRKELPKMIQRMADAAADGGVIYTSFKYGSFEGMKDGRYFTYLTENAFRELLDGVNCLEIKEIFVTGDARPGRGDEKWLNALLLKKTSI